VLGLELPLSLLIRVPAIEELALHRLFLPQLRTAGISIPPVRMTDTSKKSALDRARRNEGRRALIPRPTGPLQRNWSLDAPDHGVMRPRPVKVRVTGLFPTQAAGTKFDFCTFLNCADCSSQTPAGRSFGPTAEKAVPSLPVLFEQSAPSLSFGCWAPNQRRAGQFL